MRMTMNHNILHITKKGNKLCSYFLYKTQSNTIVLKNGMNFSFPFSSIFQTCHWLNEQDILFYDSYHNRLIKEK